MHRHPGLRIPAAAGLAAALALGGCSGNGGAGPGSAGAAWVRVHDASHHLAFSYPRTWQRAGVRLTPHLVEPVELLSVATFRPRPGGGPNCAQFPVRALEQLGPGGALVSLQEAGAPDGLPHRPATFGPRSGAADESGLCTGAPRRFFHRIIAFADHGRGFYAYVALGPRALARTRAQAWGILNSLRIGS